jgi:signal transduction histidine kinase
MLSSVFAENARLEWDSPEGGVAKMRLTLEISLALGIAILVVLTGATAIGVERELRLMERDLTQDHVFLGAQLASAVERLWKAAGPEEALALLDTESNAGNVLARWRWLDEDYPVGPRLAPSEAKRLRRGNTVTLSLRAGDGTETRQTLVPVRTPDGRWGAVEIQEPVLHTQEDLWGREVKQAALTVGAAAAVSGVLAVALGVFLVGKPVRMLVEKARRIGAGDLTGDIVLGQRDELGELAREMNAMGQKLAATRERAELSASERISALEQLRHADRLTTIGKLASGIGHELGTPLAIVNGRAELVLDAYEAGTPAHDNAAIILDQARKMASTIRQFLDFARRRHTERARHDVRQLLEQTLGLLSTLADRRGLSLAIDGCGTPEWDLDAFQIQQAVANLVINGIQATLPGGRLVIGYEVRSDPRLDGAERAEGDSFLHLYVSDEGTGIPPELLERVFEPFFTTKEVGEGTGLGLSIAQGIVRDHGGWIDVESELGKGSSFSIWLPKGEAV